MKTRKRKLQPQEAFVAAVIPTESHIVTRDGQPCTLINVSGMHRGGVLIPGSPAIMFDKCRDAERAVERTEKARRTLASSLVAEWMAQQFPSFTEGAKFEIVACGHQKEPEPTLPSPAAAATTPRLSRQMTITGTQPGPLDKGADE